MSPRKIHVTRGSLGRGMKVFRERNLLSCVALARALGVTDRTVRNIESGAHVASYTTAQRFKDLVKRYEKEQ